MAIRPSILRREKHRRDGAICFGDDPELLSAGRLVGREESESFSKRHFVLLDVLFAEITPVAALMAQQGCGNLQCGECDQRSRRRADLAQGELGLTRKSIHDFGWDESIQKIADLFLAQMIGLRSFAGKGNDPNKQAPS